MSERIRVIDSHTGGEPTRVVIEGFPDLPGNSMAERRLAFAREFDAYRRALICEPRGSDILVGALLTQPLEPTCDFGVVFFNNEGVLNMCGHGTIGLAETLRYMGHDFRTLRLDTPVGVVTVHASEGGNYRFENVPSYRFREHVPLEIDGQEIHGDIAWGGNWFFLCKDHGKALRFTDRDELSAYTVRIMEALEARGITGEKGGKIDHVELFGPPEGHAHARNFVMCPGGAFDRSPCGTGTSAKVACLAADGSLSPGEIWLQESITGSVFEASYRHGDEGRVIPTVGGRAWVVAESTLILGDDDPLKWGIT